MDGGFNHICRVALRRLRIAAIALIVLIFCGAAASGAMAVEARSESRRAKAAALLFEQRSDETRKQLEKAQDDKERADKATEDADAAKIQAEEDEKRAKASKDVSSSALLQSVVAPFVKDPVMLASEVRLRRRELLILCTCH